jgi:hypothetical protein
MVASLETRLLLACLSDLEAWERHPILSEAIAALGVIDEIGKQALSQRLVRAELEEKGFSPPCLHSEKNLNRSLSQLEQSNAKFPQLAEVTRAKTSLMHGAYGLAEGCFHLTLGPDHEHLLNDITTQIQRLNLLISSAVKFGQPGTLQLQLVEKPSVVEAKVRQFMKDTRASLGPEDLQRFKVRPV